MDNNQPINPIQPTSDTPTTPQPVQDVPTTYGDKESKKEGLISAFMVTTLLLALYGLRGIGSMSLTTSQCSALDSTSSGLCASFNTTLIIKNICFAVIMVSSIIVYFLARGKKKLTRTLGVALVALSGISPVVIFLTVNNLINTIGDAVGSRAISSYTFAKINLEFGIFAAAGAIYGIVWIIYLLSSKRAKEVFIN